MATTKRNTSGMPSWEEIVGGSGNGGSSSGASAGSSSGSAIGSTSSGMPSWEELTGQAPSASQPGTGPTTRRTPKDALRGKKLQNRAQPAATPATPAAPQLSYTPTTGSAADRLRQGASAASGAAWSGFTDWLDTETEYDRELRKFYQTGRQAADAADKRRADYQQQVEGAEAWIKALRGARLDTMGGNSGTVTYNGQTYHVDDLAAARRKAQSQIYALRDTVLPALGRTAGDAEKFARSFSGETEFEAWARTEKGLSAAHELGYDANDWYHRVEGEQTLAQRDLDLKRQELQQLQGQIQDMDAVIGTGGYVDQERYVELMRQADEKRKEVQAAQRDSHIADLREAFAQGARFDDVSGKADFNEGVQRGKAKWAQQSARVEAERASTVQAANLGNVEAAGFTEAPSDFYTYRTPQEGNGWTGEQTDTWYYLYGQNPQDAYDYAISLNRALRSKKREEQMKRFRDFGGQNGWSEAAAWAYGVPSVFTSGWDYASDLVEYANTGLVMPRTTLSPSDWADAMTAGAAQALNEWSGTISDEIPVIGGKGAGDVFQLSQSIAQSAMMAQFGVIDPGMAGKITNLVFFGSAAKQTTEDALQRGATPEQALVLGFLSGTAEALGESVSIESLIKTGGAETLRQMLWDVVKQAGIEASEEGVTTLLNTFADEIVMGDKSELRTAIQANLDRGMSQQEAEKAAWADWTEGLAVDALGGFLSGGVSAGGKYAIGGVAKAAGDAIRTRATRDAVDYSLALGSDTLLYPGAKSDRTTAAGAPAAAPAETAQTPAPSGAATQTPVSGAAQVTQARGRLLDDIDIGPALDSISGRALKKGSQERQQAFAYAVARAAELAGLATSDRGGKILPVGNYSFDFDAAAAAAFRREHSDLAAQIDSAVEKRFGAQIRSARAADEAASQTRQEAAGARPAEAVTETTATGQNADPLSTTTKSGEPARITGAEMQDGEIVLRTKQGGKTETVKADELQLDEYQQSTLQTLTDILGDDAVEAFNGLLDSGSYVSGYDVAQYATAFGHIRDLFGAKGQSEQAALQSNIRGKLTDTQVLRAYHLGKQQGVRQLRVQGKSRRGRGKVSLNGATLQTGDGAVRLQAVQNRREVLDSKEYKAIKFIAKALGIDVVLFQSETDADQNVTGLLNGAYLDGTIYLDWYAGMRNAKNVGERMLLRTMGHELTHFIQQNARGKYLELKDFVLRYMADSMGQDFNDLVVQKMETLGLGLEAAEDEVVADACETMLQDKNAVMQLAEAKPSLFEKIRQWINDFLDRIGLIVADSEEAKAIQPALKQIQELWNAGLKEAVESREELVTDESGVGDVVNSEGSKKAASTGGGVQFSAREEVRKMDIPWDADEKSTIKMQEARVHDRLMKTAPVTTVQYDPETDDYVALLDETLRGRFGYKISRQDGISFLFDKEAIRTIRHYVSSDAEAAAAIAAPYVLKRGEIISGHKHHKGGLYPSLTFSAAVDLNGEKGIESVVVLFADKDRVHALRISGPDGKEFELPVMKKETAPEMEGVGVKAPLTRPTGAASGDSVSRPDGKSNTPVQFSRRDAAARDREYSDAVASGDMETAQRMVDEAAKAAGYNRRAFHGTVSQFWTFRRGNEGIHFGTLEQAQQTLEKDRWRHSTMQYPIGTIVENLDRLNKDQLEEIAYGVGNWKYGGSPDIPEVDVDVFWKGTEEDVRRYVRGYVKKALDLYPGLEKTGILSTKPLFNEYQGRMIDAYVKMQHPMIVPVDIGEWTTFRIADILLAKLDKKDSTYYKYDRAKKNGDNQKWSPADIKGIELTEADRAELTRISKNYLGYEELVKFLHSKGVDSIEYTNMYEGTEDAPSYLLLDPEQVKLADPVTYDDSGEVIPLSQRFDSSKGDIRFSRRDAAASDREYSDAVARGDMETAQRMVDEAADKAGYDIQASHITDADFTVFDRDRLGANTDGNASDWTMAATAHLGFWFTDSPGSVSQKMSLERTKEIRSRLKISHPYEAGLYQLADEISDRYFQWRGYSSWEEIDEEIAERSEADVAKDAAEIFVNYLRYQLGFDGIIVNDEEFGGTSYVIFDPEQVKSADPVTYDDSGEVIPLSQRFDSSTGDIRFSLRPVAPVRPSSDAWKPTHTTEEAMEAYPNLWNVAAEESEKRNPTQIASTQGTYRKIYTILKNQGFTGTILDASSGLGLGTKVGREEFGFDVDDIEPYPDASYKPKYTDYSRLHKQYDAIISSAVLNVLPQDQRDALVVKMGELLRPGGRMYITTRGTDVESLAKTGKNIHLGDMEWIETVKGSYQKGFTQSELKAYLEDALGPDFTVELSSAKNGGKFNNNTSIVVTKKAATTGGGAQLSRRDAAKRDEDLLKRAYQKMLRDKQRVIDQYGKQAEADLETYQKQAEDYRAKEKEVYDGLQELDRLVRGNADPDAIKAQRDKVTAAEGRMTTALKRLSKLQERPALQQILQRERAIEREKTRDRIRESTNRKTERKRVEKKAGELYEMLTTNSDKLHVPEVLKEPLGEFLKALDFTSKRALEGGTPTKKDQKFGARLQQIQRIIEDQQRYISGDATVKRDLGGYLDISDDAMQFLRDCADMIQQATAEERDFTVNEMSADQLRELANFLGNLKSAIRNMNSFMANERFASVREAASQDITGMQALGRAGVLAENDALNKFLWQNGTPYYIFKRFGKGGESIFQGFAKGWAQMAFDARKIIDFTEKAYTAKEVKAWRKKTHDFTLEDGSKITMTTAQIMEFTMLLGREQARKHLAAGGLRLGNIKTRLGAKADQKHYHLSDADIEMITGALDAHQYAVAKEMQKFMAEQGAEWGNEVSMRRFGYRFYTEGPGYYPIKTDPNDRPMADTDAQKNSMFRLLNLSSSKSLDPRASNALVVGDIFETFTDHMADMAKLHGMGLPILDAIKWFNYKERIDRPDGTYDTRTLQGAMEQAFGSAAQRYFRTLMKDINGQTESGDRGAGIANFFIGNYKAQAVAANLRVALLQPTAYLRAATVLKPKYMAAAFLDLKASAAAVWSAEAAYKQAMRHSGEMVWKDIGGYDTDLSRSMRSQITHDETARDKVTNASMFLAEWGDKLTWGRLWSACRMQAKGEHPGISGQELTDATEELFREVIYSSQVMDSTLTRSEWMRSKSNFDKAMTAFMAEPTLSANVVMDAVSQYSLDARRDGTKKAFAKHGKRIAKMFSVYLCSQVASALVESIADAFRDDDDEEYWEKVLEALFGEDNAKRILGKELDAKAKGWLASAYEGNLMQDILFLNKLPYFKDISSLLSGFKSRNMRTDGFENLLNVYKIWRETKQLADGVLEKPTSVTYYGKMTLWGKIYKSMQAVSQLTGVPFYNLVRDVVAAWNTVMNGNHDDWKILTYDNRKSTDKLIEAIRNGESTDEERAKLAENGVDEKTIEQAVRAEIKTMFLEDLPEDEAIRLLVDEGGMRQREAEKAVAEWSSEKETGVKYDDIKEKYLAGEIDADEAAQMRVQYGGADEDDAAATVLKWQFEKDTGITWDDMRYAYVDGEITAEQAADYRVKYGGVSQEDAQALVKKWQCEKDTGLVYDDLHDLFMSGELTIKQAIDYRVKYGGQTQDNAAKTVNKWRCERDTGYEYDDIQELYATGKITRDKAVDMMVKYGGKSQDDALKTAYRYQFIGTNDRLEGVTESQAVHYYAEFYTTGMDKGTYLEAVKTIYTFKADKDANGKTITDSRLHKVAAYIDSLKITAEQKDLLFLMEYSEKNLRKAPWHK